MLHGNPSSANYQLRYSTFRSYLIIILSILIPTKQKAKAEQKYFAAMREKEAIDAERKAVLKNAFKHAVTIAKLTDQEKLLQDEAVGCFCGYFSFGH